MARAGDAVITVTADSTQLDTLTAKLQNGFVTAADKAAKAALRNAEAQANLRAAMKQASAETDKSVATMTKLAAAQTEAKAAAIDHSQAQQKLKSSLEAGRGAHDRSFLGLQLVKKGSHEARDSIDLLAGSAGVTLPRELKKLLSQLPGVSGALGAAFSAFAVVAFIEVLSEVPGKIREVTAELAGWGAEAKKSYEAQIQLNGSFRELAEQREIDTIRAKERGLEGLALTQQQIQGDKEVHGVIEKRIRDSGTLVASLHKEADAHREIIENFHLATIADAFYITDHEGQLKKATEEERRAQQEHLKAITARVSADKDAANHASELQHQSLSEFIKIESAKVDAYAKSQTSFLNLTVAEARLEETQGKISVFQRIAIEQSAAEAVLRIQQKAIDDKTALLEKDAQKNKEQIIALNQQKIDLEIQYGAKLRDELAKNLTDYKKFVDDARDYAAAHPLIVDVDQNTGAAAKVRTMLLALKTIEDAFTSLGITSQQTLGVALAKDAEAFTFLRDNGLLAMSDLLQGEAKLLQMEIELARAGGDLIPIAGLIQGSESVSDLEKQYEKLRGELKKLGIEFAAIDKISGNFLDHLGNKMKRSRGELVGWEKTADDVLAGVSGAVGQAFEAWILGQDSLGHALRKALAAELAHIAALSIAWGAYWLAWAIIDTFWNPARAGAEYVAAGEFFALAAAFGAAAYGIKPGSGGGKGGDQLAGTPITTTGSQDAPVQQQVTTTNVRRFAVGGLISTPTLAMIGDSVTGGAAREAVIPLDNPDATRQISDALGGGGTTINNTFILKGPLHANSVNSFVRDVNRGVDKGKFRLTSSVARRVTKK